MAPARGLALSSVAQNGNKPVNGGQSQGPHEPTAAQGLGASTRVPQLGSSQRSGYIKHTKTRRLEASRLEALDVPVDAPLISRC